MRDGPSRRLTGAVPPSQVAALARQQATTAIAQQVPGLLPVQTSRRVWALNVPQPGDMLTATTTSEQTFASRGQIPGPLVLGEYIRLHGGGIYTTSTLLTPTQRARIRWGNNGPVLTDTGPLGLLVGAATGLLLFDVTLVVRSLGTSGTVEAYGSVKFQNPAGGTTELLCGPNGPFASGNPITVDTTATMTDLPLSVTYSAAVAGNSNNLRIAVLHDLRPATNS